MKALEKQLHEAQHVMARQAGTVIAQRKLLDEASVLLETASSLDSLTMVEVIEWQERVAEWRSKL